VLDQSNIPLTPTGNGAGQADVREPISSSCTANPFTVDGAACQGGAVGKPLFLFTDGMSPRGLFADAYRPDTPVTAVATAITDSSATVSGTVNPEGNAVKVSFQFGTTPAYGQSTTAQTLALANVAAPFAGGAPAVTQAR
jgi:hypothetical protein